MNHRLEDRTYLTADKSKIADGKYKGPRHLLGAEGHEIPLSQAIELGLVKPEKKEVKVPKEKEKVEDPK